MTGASTRKKFFVTVYHVAHYMQPIDSQKTDLDKIQQVMQENKAKQLTLKWVRDLESQKFKRATSNPSKTL